MDASSNCSYFFKGNSASVGSYRPISILNNFSKLFEVVLRYLQFKLNACQHNFTFIITKLQLIFILLTSAAFRVGLGPFILS
jgi:hypothetical protein